MWLSTSHLMLLASVHTLLCIAYTLLIMLLFCTSAGMKGAFATRIAGSADLYNNHNRRPYHGINFIVAHDGFSLYDLVAYNSKHNDVGVQGLC